MSKRLDWALVAALCALVVVPAQAKTKTERVVGGHATCRAR